MEIDKKKILLAVTGGISAYKVYDVIQGLKAKGYKVVVMTTKSALDFISPTVLGALTEGNYVVEDVNRITHIEEAQTCAVFAVVPATYNIIGKFANGIADDLVSSTFAAVPHTTPKLIFPAMNTVMYQNCNLFLDKIHNFQGISVIEPDSGMLACGTEGIGKLPKPKKIVDEIDMAARWIHPWSFPLAMNIRGTTNDMYSFQDFDWHQSIEIPIHPHVGAFGARRRHDIHKGIDLYCAEGHTVRAVESGKIVDICPFTGAIAGFPWWEDTWGMYIEGPSGIVVYGEVNPIPNHEIGDFIQRGTAIAHVKRVIKNDKNRPMSMLHLELHDKNHLHTSQWDANAPCPEGILDPTPYLIKSLNL